MQLMGFPEISPNTQSAVEKRNSSIKEKFWNSSAMEYSLDSSSLPFFLTRCLLIEISKKVFNTI